jgi:23S rRNA (pseudouridine1915-N3)-methyltransferase
MKIVLLQTGKTTEKNLAEALDVYHSRIKKYTGFEIVTLPDVKHTKSMPVQEQKIKEGRKILQSISENDYVILLDEKGKEYSTKGFSDLLKGVLMLPKKRIIFVVGGAWGFSDEVYNRADMRLSLSKMTFPHQMVRLLFVEQLYRVFTVLNGEPYHHE